MDERTQGALNTLKDAGFIGGIGAGYQVTTDYALEQTALSPALRGVIQGVAGLAIGAALGATDMPRNVGIGFAVGGIVSGVRNLMQAARVQLYLNSVAAPAAPAAGSSAAPATGAAAPAQMGAGSSPAPGTAPAARVINYVSR